MRVNPQAKQTFPLAEFDVPTRGAHSAALPVTEHLPLMNADNERVSISALRAQSDTLHLPPGATCVIIHGHFKRGIGMGWFYSWDLCF